MSVRIKRIVLLLPVVVLVAASLTSVFGFHKASATTLNDLTSRSLAISSSSPAASNATTTYTFNFKVPSATIIQSVGIQICTTADVDIGGTCTAPTGFTDASATLASQPTGLGSATGWTIDGSEPAVNDLFISNSSNATVPGTSQTIVFSNVQNPTTANQTFYARISTYSNATWTAANIIDAGTVAASTTNPIVLTGQMPESLIFCTGQTISETNSIPDCTTATSGNISFDGLFSPTGSTYATSQMAASTNASAGYAISLTGQTLKSGSNTIKAIGATAALASIGSAQFGMNLAADTAANAVVPALAPQSAAVTPASNATNLWAAPATNFATGGAATAAEYAFNDTAPNTVANSDDSTPGTSHPTDAQIYTSTYIVDVSGSQPAGTYTTTLTYICTATY